MHDVHVIGNSIDLDTHLTSQKRFCFGSLYLLLDHNAMSTYH
jgi:hypothetical protein